MATECTSSLVELPVYEVIGTGLDDHAAEKLATALEIPWEKCLLEHGVASFHDPYRYLAVPTVVIDEPDCVASLVEKTKNPTPDTPLEVRGIDYEALLSLSPLCAEDALDKTEAALNDPHVRPHSATPIVGHTVFKTVTTRRFKGIPESTTTKLDTHVSYRFTLDGYLLVGPGAQVQIHYSPEGKVTRLLHSTRTLKKGPTVKLISADAIRSRFARRLPDDSEVNVRLVYWAPPLRPGICASPRWKPSVILPYYAVTTKRRVVNPRTREAHMLTSRVRLVPATDDCRFVPSVTLAASAEEISRVEARASVTGGTPPYTYVWAGSNPEPFPITSNTISYIPRVRDIRRILRSQTLERTENVSITVIDANGVAAQAIQALQVTAHPHPVPAGIPASGPTYGCESPNDPGDWTHDRVAWQQGMAAPGQGGGTQNFCWLADDSWPGDYIEPTPPGTLEPNAWITGDADFENWGINTANITMYIGDSDPYSICEMYPGATPDDYNSASGGLLYAPIYERVSIGSQNYTVNYNGSWGAPNPNDNLQWLATYTCQMLAQDSVSGNPWERWGPAFDGLHSILGFTTDAADNTGTPFMLDFPANILGATSTPQTLVQGWLNSVFTNQVGTPAAMGPIMNVSVSFGTFGISDYEDNYWGKGSVGPNISLNDTSGWWFIQGTDAVQDFP
jgi:hypothetical protein